MRRFVRLACMLLAASVPAAAQQITGEVVGATGASSSARFGIIGAIEPVDHARSSNAQFAIAPPTPTKRDAIFTGNFD